MWEEKEAKFYLSKSLSDLIAHTEKTKDYDTQKKLLYAQMVLRDAGMV